MNKILEGQRIEHAISTKEWLAMERAIEKKIEVQKNLMAQGMERKEYWKTVGKIQGLRAVKIAFKQAIQVKNKLQKDE